MQLSEIREEVKLILQDGSDADAFSNVVIDSYINDVYMSVSAACLIPELKGLDTVSTVLLQAYTTMTGVTGGFSGVLSRVYDSDSQSLQIVNSLEELIDLNGDLSDSGSVEMVALEGSTLWYYPIPTTMEVLTVVYYKNPDLLVLDSSVPDAFPEFVHRKILVNGAAAICFNLVEDGIDGNKINAQSRELAKMQGVVQLREWLAKTRRHYVHSQEPF